MGGDAVAAKGGMDIQKGMVTGLPGGGFGPTDPRALEGKYQWEHFFKLLASLSQQAEGIPEQHLPMSDTAL